MNLNEINLNLAKPISHASAKEVQKKQLIIKSLLLKKIGMPVEKSIN